MTDNSWTPEGWSRNMTNWLFDEGFIKKDDIKMVERVLRRGVINFLRENKKDD